MPLYQYELIDESGCKLCGGRFELMRPLSRPALTACPVCKRAVRKCVGSVFAPKVLRPVGAAEARSAGFKMFKKVSTGVYEAQ